MCNSSCEAAQPPARDVDSQPDVDGLTAVCLVRAEDRGEGGALPGLLLCLEEALDRED